MNEQKEQQKADNRGIGEEGSAEILGQWGVSDRPLIAQVSHISNRPKARVLNNGTSSARIAHNNYLPPPLNYNIDVML